MSFVEIELKGCTSLFEERSNVLRNAKLRSYFLTFFEFKFNRIKGADMMVQVMVTKLFLYKHEKTKIRQY